MDSDSGAPIAGKVVVGRADATDDAARPFAVRTSPVTGWYFRILTPGRWRVTASAPGYSASSRIVDVPEGKYSLAHFQLTREGAIPDKVPTSSGGRPALGISLDTVRPKPCDDRTRTLLTTVFFIFIFKILNFNFFFKL